MNEIQSRLGLHNGLSTLVIGAPGSGKSWLSGSIADFGTTEVLVTKPKEASSYHYTHHPNIRNVEIFHDPNWSPALGQHEASAFIDLIKYMDELMHDDDVDNIVIDPLTDVHKLLKREILSAEDAGRMNEMSDARGAWGDVRELWEETADKISALTYAPTPKNVVATVHAKVPSEEERESQDVEYISDVLPSIQGSFKTLLEGEFQVVVHSRVITEFDPDEREQISKYRVEVRADSERHSKVAVAPALEAERLPNEFSAIVEAIEEAQDESN